MLLKAWWVNTYASFCVYDGNMYVMKLQLSQLDARDATTTVLATPGMIAVSCASASSGTLAALARSISRVS